MTTITKHRSAVVRREQIIDAARKLVIKRGSEHLRVREIAKVAGITEGAIYRHFKSKKEILSSLVDRIEENWLEDISKVNAAGSSSLEALDRIFKNHVSAIEQRGGVSFQVIAEIISLGDKKLNKKAFDVLNKYTGRLKKLLAEGVGTGEIKREVDLEAAAMLFFGMIQGLVNIWALSGYSFDLEEKYKPLWHTFRESIRNRV